MRRCWCEIASPLVPNRNPVLHIEIIVRTKQSSAIGCNGADAQSQETSSKAPAEVTSKEASSGSSRYLPLRVCNNKSAGRSKRCSRSSRTSHSSFSQTLPDFLSKHSLAREIRGQSAIIPHRGAVFAISRCIGAASRRVTGGATVNQSSMSTV